MEIIGASERYKAQKYDACALVRDCRLQIILKPLLNKDNLKKKSPG